MDAMSLINRMLAPVKQRIFLLFARGLLTAIRDNPNGFQMVAADLLADESADGMNRYQEYGFASKPKAGANVLAAFLAGNRSHGVVLCIDDVRYRFTSLAPGEVCLSTCWDENGQSEHRVHFKEGKIVDIYGDMVNLGSATGLKALINETAKDMIEGHCHEYISPAGPLATSGAVSETLAVPATVLLVPGTIPAAGYTQHVKGA